MVEAFAEGQYVEAPCCDLSKAFDCVSHDILVEKLEAYGIDEIGLKLLVSYLRDRYQVTSFGQSTPTVARLTHGVP